MRRSTPSVDQRYLVSKELLYLVDPGNRIFTWNKTGKLNTELSRRTSTTPSFCEFTPMMAKRLDLLRIGSIAQSRLWSWIWVWKRTSTVIISTRQKIHRKLGVQCIGIRGMEIRHRGFERSNTSIYGYKMGGGRMGGMQGKLGPENNGGHGRRLSLYNHNIYDVHATINHIWHTLYQIQQLETRPAKWPIYYCNAGFL